MKYIEKVIVDEMLENDDVADFISRLYINNRHLIPAYGKVRDMDNYLKEAEAFPELSKISDDEEIRRKKIVQQMNDDLFMKRNLKKI